MVFMFIVYNGFNDLKLRDISVLAQNMDGVFWIPTTRDFPASLVNFLSLCTAFWHPKKMEKDSSGMK